MSQSYSRADSKVEVSGFEARHYDRLMDLATVGTYPRFLRRAVTDMAIAPLDEILDLAAGTGRNACAMAHHLSEQGRIVCVDIGREMLEQARRRCRRFPQITVERGRIEEPLPYREAFDKVLLSFALHGFIQEERLAILENVHRSLRPGGRLLLLDWNEFEPGEALWPVRFVFRHVECRLATDFARRDVRSILHAVGFGAFKTHLYYRGYVRLLRAVKPGISGSASPG